MRKFGATGHRCAEAAASVSSFLERLYYSIAETLPHEPEPRVAMLLTCAVFTD